MEERYKNIIMFALVDLLVFLVIATASASIEIRDIGIQYDMIEHYGYMNYQNTANYNVSGAILVFIDGGIVAGKIVDMPIRYVAGFRCSPTKTLEFSLNTTKGDHIIVAYALSQNLTAQCSYEYYAEDWWDQEPEDVEGFEEVKEDWLKCWKGGEQGRSNAARREVGLYCNRI